MKVNQWLSRRSGDATHQDDSKFMGGFTDVPNGEPLVWRSASAAKITSGTDVSDSYNPDTFRVVTLLLTSDGTVGGLSMQSRKEDGTPGPQSAHLAISGFCQAQAYDDVQNTP